MGDGRGHIRGEKDGEMDSEGNKPLVGDHQEMAVNHGTLEESGGPDLRSIR